MKFNYIHHIQISINSVTLIVTLPSVTMSDALLLVTLIVTLLSVTMSVTLLLVTLIVSTAWRCTHLYDVKKYCFITVD